MYNDQLVYKVVIWAFFGISLWTEKVALSCMFMGIIDYERLCSYILVTYVD